MDTDKYAETEHVYSVHHDIQPVALRANAQDVDAPDALDALWRKWFGDRVFDSADWKGDENLSRVFEIFDVDIRQYIDAHKTNAKAKELGTEIARVLNEMYSAELTDARRSTAMIRIILDKFDKSQKLIMAVKGVFSADTAISSELHVDDLGVWRYLPHEEQSKARSSSRLVMYALNDLATSGYRRYKDRIVKRVMTGDGNMLRTCAWETVGTIADYTNSLTRRRLWQPQLWSWIMSASGYTAVDNLTQYIEKCDDIEIDFIEPDRHIFSFRNGVYLAKDEMFILYTEAPAFFSLSKYPTACKHFDLDFSPEDVNVADPMQIPTPSVDVLFDSQHLSPIVKRWAFCLLGRLMYVP